MLKKFLVIKKRSRGTVHSSILVVYYLWLLFYAKCRDGIDDVSFSEYFLSRFYTDVKDSIFEEKEFYAKLEEISSVRND